VGGCAARFCSFEVCQVQVPGSVDRAKSYVRIKTCPSCVHSGTRSRRSSVRHTETKRRMTARAPETLPREKKNSADFSLSAPGALAIFS
jgi:ribosome-binding protein aMBF1 (putative translation factor)